MFNVGKKVRVINSRNGQMIGWIGHITTHEPHYNQWRVEFMKTIIDGSIQIIFLL